MKICYFGIYDPEFSRNTIYMDGLRQNGAEIIECNDRSKGFLKFWRLYKKHQKIKDEYDVMIVGYPSQVAVPLARLISRKKIVLDALCSLYEGEIISRGAGTFRASKTWIIDFLAYYFADVILVESNAQIDFFVESFFVRREKLHRVFTGASDKLFFIDQSIQKRTDFTVVFRGQFLPEAGVDTILKSAKILQENNAAENIQFLFMGKDFGNKKLSKKVAEMNLKNIEFVSGFLTFKELREKMLSCHVSLGQFARHERLDRTIPHKAFETLALGIPYVTARSKGVSELLTDKENCSMTHIADPKDLAEKILELKHNPDLMQKLGDNGLALYKEKLTPKILAKQILVYCDSISIS